MTPGLTADIGPDEMVLHGENRVRGFSPLSWDCLGRDVPISVEDTSENGSAYDGSRRQILNYLRARYYDPTTAQFLTRDPAVASTMSPYAYVAGNPLNATDPMGLDSNCSIMPNPFDSNSCLREAVGNPGVQAAMGEAATAEVPGSGYAAHNTVSLCVGANGAVGVGGEVSACVVVTHLHQIGSTETAGVGIGMGGGAGAAVNVSNAPDIKSLDGWSWDFIAGFVLGGSVSVGLNMCNGVPISPTGVAAAGAGVRGIQVGFQTDIAYTATQTWLSW